jgi:hypothetical protein
MRGAAVTRQTVTGSGKLFIDDGLLRENSSFSHREISIRSACRPDCRKANQKFEHHQ